MAGGVQLEIDAVAATEWKEKGGAAYQQKDWQAAAQCYTEAISRCSPTSPLAISCFNNRAACYMQLKNYEAVVKDASVVLEQEPSNVKALARRMVSYDALKRASEALEDAGSILTMDPKHVHALQVVAKARKNMGRPSRDAASQEVGSSKSQEEAAPRSAPAMAMAASLCVFLFTEDNPFQCYTCLRSLRKHLSARAAVDVYVFWQAKNSDCMHSYQLLQTLPETSTLPSGSLSWLNSSNGQLLPSFSRIMNRLSVEGKQHVLFLSDEVLFHSDVDVASALRVLNERREVFSLRLDLNPRIDFFPEASLLTASPAMKCFSGNESLLIWMRNFDRSKMAYEAVPRESGWDAILDWTATILRVEQVQHFFSALVPPIKDREELDNKAADWLSRRQRMKQSEISHKSACFAQPLLVAVEHSLVGDAHASDRTLRWHLFTSLGVGCSQDATQKLASKLSWQLSEVKDYFKDVAPDDMPAIPLDGLLAPEGYRSHYFSSVRVCPKVPKVGLPKSLQAPAPLISWLVPVRNAEFFIDGCFASLEDQVNLGPGACEVIFVEDGSEDRSLDVLRRLADDHPHVQLVENPTQLGVAGSLAEGWRHCHGDFVARLDADDEAAPNRLVTQLRYLERHRSLSILGSRVRQFWTETRRCSVETITEKGDGRVSVAAWREFHGTQTSRQREVFTLRRRGPHVVVEGSSAEYAGCRVLRIGDHLVGTEGDAWKKAISDVEHGLGEVLLERRDPLEPPTGGRTLHPLMVRATSVFEDCVAGTTATFRRGHFSEQPFEREEAEGHWTVLSLPLDRHAANLGDALVHARRHEGNRGRAQASGIYESSCAAALKTLKDYKLQVDMQDAEAFANFRGPKSKEQGERLLEVIGDMSKKLLAKFVHTGNNQKEELGDQFHEDFIAGKEMALERALLALQHRFKALVLEVSRVVTNPDSPRHSRRRSPPR
mmetsp:Transcript_17164/g.36884  ORF Transcript_17164/g.36884 Transcript_17164/m.36884 type:complete len:947 (-) Transcript_17164:201-3041(-)|eukprot:CAMPEP_0206426254 /NCGR_PEP_ID=MMETSP0324_2-20121206/4265_1 /ASSEMBLY_ACC=CAM_ASM_000836 /TAXON_ID=2866 /ORGANISM="Crypthecodinium cohnii, Strain Seligo" /LENGTH=946 /DNA_ID=CAMNT_0053891167 /DNA_START=116 /DNA_END=2956 /DNA_ORIENTATION=+